MIQRLKSGRDGWWALGWAVLLVALAAVPSEVRAARPNVVILLSDDQGYGDLSSHGNPVLMTPNLDRLRAESIRFTDFHAAPMCTPTRGQLLTGLDALRNGATSVTAGRSFVRPGVPTLPALFQAAGYRTGIFGKWHLGDSYPNRPMDKGFQEAAYHLGWGFTSAPEFQNTLFDGRYAHNGQSRPFSGYCTDFWFDRARAWMAERAAANEPFLCYIPTNAPHAPHVVHERYAMPYADKGPANFLGMIANIDENLGKLEAFLAEQGLRENTILVFMTDNGGTAGVRVFNAGMRGHKTEYYEGGHRVPCFVRWPGGGLGAPRDIAVPAQVQDVLPTLLDLCAIPGPADVRFDGSSLVPLLQGAPASDWPERMLVVQYGQVPRKWESTVIWNSWRLVLGRELYDLATDPAQARDVAREHGDVFERMKAHYERWWTRIEPTLDDFVSIILGAPEENPVQLTSSDWQDIYCDNANHIRRGVGGPRGGHWNVNVARDGLYRLTLRRWPPSSGWLLGSNGDGADGAKAFPIAAAHVELDGQSASVPAVAESSRAVVELRLAAGQGRLRAWFRDSAGHDLCGAFYTTVTWVGP